MNDKERQALCQDVRDLITQHLDNSLIIYSHEGMNVSAAHVLVALNRRCISTTRALIILIAEREISEAQALLRTVIEGSVKLGYILSGGQDAGSRLSEYANTLYEFQQLRDYEDAERVRDSLKAKGVPPAFVDANFRNFFLPPTEKIRALKKANSRVESNWKIYRLLEEVYGEDIILFPLLLKEYAFSCHFAHASHASLQMFEDEHSLEKPEPNHFEKMVVGLLSIVTELAVLRFTQIGAMFGTQEVVLPSLSASVRAQLISMTLRFL